MDILEITDPPSIVGDSAPFGIMLTSFNVMSALEYGDASKPPT